MKVRFYGRLAGLFGPEIEVPAPAPCTVASLRQQLARAHPEAANSLCDERVRAVVADTIVRDGHGLEPSDEVEFLAPVSGG